MEYEPTTYKIAKCTECNDGYELVRDRCVDPTEFRSVCTDSVNCKQCYTLGSDWVFITTGENTAEVCTSCR